mgnify:CR=1 FL=1|nr:RnfABCDGE type electron transport complex subunit D [uncultured Flavobacterium sp.]
MNLHPHIKQRFNGTQLVMLDVVIALLPVLFAGWLAYGSVVLIQLGIAIVTALVTDFVFSALLLNRYKTFLDGSAIVTAILLVCTLAPLTPWYVVAFGAFTAVLFGKIVWGGLGKNRFNPALVGREFMSVFFSAAMTSPTLWKSNDLINLKATNLVPGIGPEYFSEYISSLIYKTGGAMGEYSILALLMGGLYLVLRNRISWHIPLALLSAFIALCWLNESSGLSFSLAGILLGTIFMATDMPSSPTTSGGKLYYGMMIGIITFIFIRGGVRFEYMSYSILLMNAFSEKISTVFKPVAWGEQQNYRQKTEAVFMLTFTILMAACAVLTLHWHELTKYLIYIYIVYIVFKFNFSYTKSVNKYV